MIGMLGTMVRVMVTGSRSVKYSVLTSSNGVIIVWVPLNRVAKYVYVEYKVLVVTESVVSTTTVGLTGASLATENRLDSVCSELVTMDEPEV